ncbi:beta family protein [Bacillus cereus]|uniref:beta family protein n=1 Tax=Bacillus cereus TaxID=1396 RepID=UPI000BF8A93F|nr:beta family protein [Bacillus cereus]MEB9946749.1 beta family protein [Bacillus cereus]PFF41027.1 hypothetical protein CN328_18260 [Bacillus cereus]PGN92995.1 hypothetical protein CN965_16285 [Bacillus cereus]PGV27937.1 hypothetical protein COD79_26080 [Bacillus cereus]PGX87188.1 hypothetical protein COE28_09885 [Bacillus cereus]
MTNQNHYVPILKWKMGEKNALKQVTIPSKERMTPLIEIQPPQLKTVNQHLENIGKHIKTCWNMNSPILIDVDQLYSDGTDKNILMSDGSSPIEFIFNSIFQEGSTAIPVYGFYLFNDSQYYENEIKKIAQLYNTGICLRLTQNDLADLSTLTTNLHELQQDFHLTRDKIDIILDFEDISNQEDTILSKLTNILLNFPNIHDWRMLTVCSTSFPSELSKKVATKTQGKLPRIEWQLYLAINKINLARIPTYGDYTVVNPQMVTDFDPSYMDVAATIKYTTNDNFLIFRGSGLKSNGYQQYRSLATDIVNHQKYKGRSFSFGDNYIYECAHSPNSNTGNLTTWVTNNVNHHLELVVQSLSTQSDSLVSN